MSGAGALEIFGESCLERFRRKAIREKLCAGECLCLRFREHGVGEPQPREHLQRKALHIDHGFIRAWERPDGKAGFSAQRHNPIRILFENPGSRIKRQA